MSVKGCVFDFSGTIFRAESADRWLRGALATTGVDASEAEIRLYARRLDAVGALPGGRSPRRVPRHLRPLWRVRDRSAELHRAAFVGLARETRLPWPRAYDALYARHMTPQAWTPYPDTVEVLSTLRERGVRVAVLSNIGWDLRPVLRAHGVDRLVDTVVLSFEEGVQKPDPRIFRTVCDQLGLAPRDVLMVGDDARADGGATTVGCSFHQVEHRPVEARPDGLRPVLDLVG